MSRENYIRESIPNLSLRQNCDIGRIASIHDPNVDVIYICPLQMSEDVKNYYNKLLEVGGCENLETRLRIITPQAAEKLPPTFSLTSTFLYSRGWFLRFYHAVVYFLI